ncbi:SUMO-activating enzyme subunit 1-like [Artemia franciscana]|uniref:THIF-type NAD/FAD binding fold domain-containing protein n=1 Tax=Artemia franciscana TaxID=6661 RepID=A0AA88H5T2_ARTSF|nr:hypothetical protein QYM36_015793 [Artemia franciscana]
MVSSENGSEAVRFTEDEVDVYDRQIRLWGVLAQKALKAAKIVIIGSSYMANEVAKNLALVGVNELMIVNQKKDSVTEFLQAVNRIQRLNPMVKVNAAENGLSALSNDVIAEYSVIVGTNCRRDEIQRLKDIADTKQKCLFIGETFGLFGFFCADFIIEPKKKDEGSKDNVSNDKESNNKESNDKGNNDKESKDEVKKARHLPFLSIEGGLSNAKNRAIGAGFMLSQIILEFRDKFDRLPEKDKKDEDRKNLVEIREKIRQLSKTDKVTDAMLENVYGDEISVAAVVGGVLSQEIVRAITRHEKTIDNFFFFDSFALSGTVQQLEAE